MNNKFIMNSNYKISSRLFLSKLFILIIAILVLFVGYKLYINHISYSENFDEKIIKTYYPDLLIDTGYEPHLYTNNPLPNDIFDKYSIKSNKRDLKEFTDILYLGNPL